jgi:hypothetical protein
MTPADAAAKPPAEPATPRRRARIREGRMTALIELDGVGLDWLCRVHAIDPRVLELTGAELRRAVGLAVSELVRVSSRV